MQRRDFLRSGLALGAAALIPNTELVATNAELPSLSAITENEFALLDTATQRTGPLYAGEVLTQREIEALLTMMTDHDPEDVPSFTGLVLPPLNGSEVFDLLVYAIKKKHLEFVKSLIRQGVDVNAKNRIGTPLDYAVTYSSVEVVQYLISQGADVNAGSGVGDTPLHLAVFENSDIEIVKCLVAHGADVNGRDNFGNTPLFEAVGYSPRIDRLEYLISHGADVHAKNNEGETALDYALKRQYADYPATNELLEKAIELLKRAMEEKSLPEEVKQAMYDYAKNLLLERGPVRFPE